ncbi:hypothetical protein ACWCWD_26865 [Streptomyces sp. NPDC001493]
MNSDAKIIILYMESHPSVQRPQALGPLCDFARDAGIKPGPYQKAKKFLKREGYLHEWRYRRSGGRWATAQILSNEPSTRQRAEEYWERCGEYADLESEELDGGSGGYVDVALPQVAPSDYFPAVGVPGSQSIGGSLPDVKTLENSYPLPTRLVRESKTERKAYGRKFAKVSQFAEEEGEGFWVEPPEWLNDPESEKLRTEKGQGEPEEKAERGTGAAPVSVPASPVPVHVPVVPVPVHVPVAPEPVRVPEREPVHAAAQAPEPEPEPEPQPKRKPVEEWGAEEVTAERVLLSLVRASSQLHLGVQEARQLVDLAAEWMRRGVSASELRRALVSSLPEAGVHSPPGFVRKRLVLKMPAPLEYFAAAPGAVAVGAARPQGVDSQGVDSPSVRPQGVRPQGVEEKPPYEPPPPLVTCEGPGDDHVFRAMSGEVLCGQCRSAEAWAAWAAHREAAARARGEDGLTGDGKGGWRDVLAGAAAPPGTEHDPAEEAAAYTALERSGGA